MLTKNQGGAALGAAAIGIVLAAAAWTWGDDPPRAAATPKRLEGGEPPRRAIALPGLAPGACVASDAPRANGRTVFLDAGHGGPDSGATAGSAFAEKNLVLAIATETASVLRDRGYRVVLSRTTDSTATRLRRGDRSGRRLTAAAVKRDLVARNRCANAGAADVAVSVHLNSFDDSTVGGTETVYNANRAYSARNRRLATLLQTSMLASLGASGLASDDRGVRTDAGAGGAALTREAAAYGQLLLLGPAAPPWFTSPTRMPAVVVEPLFVTNPVEVRFAASAAGRDALARGVAAGLDAYFGRGVS